MRTNFPSPRTIDYETIKRRAYIEDGILVVSLNDPSISWETRELLRQVGDRKYGRKAQPGEGATGERNQP